MLFSMKNLIISDSCANAYSGGLTGDKGTYQSSWNILFSSACRRYRVPLADIKQLKRTETAVDEYRKDTGNPSSAGNPVHRDLYQQMIHVQHADVAGLIGHPHDQIAAEHALRMLFF